jgi:hypothetical protein
MTPIDGEDPPRDVTPDLVAQHDETYGVVAEAKGSLPRSEQHWHKAVRQARRYDTDLSGWWTPNAALPMHDTVLLVNLPFSRGLRECLQELSETEPGAVGPSTSIIEFTREEGPTVAMFLRLEHGTLRSPTLARPLHRGQPIPLDAVLRSFGAIRYYDDPPPLPYLLEELWTELFPEQAAGATNDEQLKGVPIDVTVAQIAQVLQCAHGSRQLEVDLRSRQFPTRTSVKAALEALVKLGMAIPAKGVGSYKVIFRPLRGDVFEKFALLLEKHGIHAPDNGPVADASGQLFLFPLADNEEPEDASNSDPPTA